MTDRTQHGKGKSMGKNHLACIWRFDPRTKKPLKASGTQLDCNGTYPYGITCCDGEADVGDCERFPSLFLLSVSSIVPKARMKKSLPSIVPSMHATRTVQDRALSVPPMKSDRVLDYYTCPCHHGNVV